MEQERTERGFGIFGRISDHDGGTWRVQESSLAFEGAHVRIVCIESIGKASPMLLQYVYRKGGAVLRLPHEITPAKAEQWHRLLDKVPG